MEIYRTPASRFVADFIGRANFVDGVVLSPDEDSLGIEVFGQDLRAPAVQHSLKPGEAVTVVVRPEMVLIDPEKKAHTKGIITQAAYLGNHIEYVVEIQGQTF